MAFATEKNCAVVPKILCAQAKIVRLSKKLCGWEQNILGGGQNVLALRTIFEKRK
jgi:hypothetical protein